MQITPITPQETLHLHEILTLKNTCALKSAALCGSTGDPELQKILNQDVKNAKRQIQDIRNTLSPAIGCQSQP